MATQRKSPMDHPAVVTFLILAVIAAMSLAAEVLKPLALAVLLSFALVPLAGFFERRRVPRVIAVLLTVALALGCLSGIGFVVVRQLSMLANQLPSYQERIQKKVDFLKPSEDTVFSRAQKVAGDVLKSLDTPIVPGPQAMDVRVVEQPTFRQRLQAAVGPSMEFLGVGTFVLILVLFMLMNREDVGDRIVQLFGQRRINLTTRTMGEIGQRISRYLAMITLVNAGYGLIVGLGLWAIGVPYAVLWGCLAAMMRFIPYVGAAAAFLLPLVFSVAHFPGWRQPLEVVAFFGAAEVALSYLEPVFYGKTAGVSALGLLVAAMFWTWLWGLLGTLLSTPLTLSLAVLGKYVPSLGFFATILGEEAELDQDIRFYQRLVSLDQDGTTAVVEAALKERPRAEVFDQILVPALSRAGRDAARGELEESDMAFIRRVIGEILDDLEGTEEISVKTAAGSGEGEPGRVNGTPASPPFEVAGVAANGSSDALALRMLGQILAPSKCTLVILEGAGSPMQLAERVAEASPAMVILSHLPPEALAQARYQVRRLRSRFAGLPIVVGRWGEEVSDAASEGLSGVGATHVAFTLADARDQIMARAAAAVPVKAAAVPVTVMAAATRG
ncbi:MAG TPA: AI-2E family transporter [Opitutaceae bacterium]|nr:AI-2E family transporter [Opitutaceae bacterium]